MKYYRWIILSVLLILITIVALTLFVTPTEPARKVATITRPKAVKRAIQMLEDANHATIGAQLRETSGGGTMQEKWELLLIDDAGRLQMEPKDIRESLCCDAWGNRLNVELKTNLIARKVSIALTQSPLDVIVWSSGANGENEFGNGDDVVLPQE